MRSHRGLAISLLVALCAVTPLAAGFDIDADGDGFGAAVDCNDGNDQVWAISGEALNLRFAGKTTLAWDSAQNPGGTPGSVRFDTLRSTSPSNFASAPPGSCLDPEGLTTSSTDASVPPPGTVFFYVVRTKNDCGDGTIGNRSGGAPRSGMTCDCSVLCSDGLTCTRDHCVDGNCAHDPIQPAIHAPPQAVAVCPGSDAHFSIAATGQGTLHYQWKKGNVIVGNDAPALTLSGLAGADNGAGVTCAVTDTCAAATSPAAVLTVFASAASCSGGGSGQEAPNGASEPSAWSMYGGMNGGLNGQINGPMNSGMNSGMNGGMNGGFNTGMNGGFNGGMNRSSAYLFSGEYYLEATDLEIQGRGFDFEWSRKYRSREGHLTGLGYNWDFSYNRFVTQDLPGTDLIVADGRSRRDRYQLSFTGCWTAPGFFRELCPQPDGSYVLTFPNRTTWKFRALDGSAAQGRIEEIRDSNQNAMTFSYSPAGRLTVVTDTLGRSMTISYNGDGYISSVIDFAGRHVTYGYYGPLEAGGMPGDLKSVTSPAVTGTSTGNDFPLGKTTTYTYMRNTGNPELDHNLLTITDPLGQVVLRNTYTTAQSAADPRFDRIDRQTLPNGTIGYVYVAQSPSPGSDAVTKTIVNDRAGNVEEVFFNGLNQVVMTREYAGRAPVHAVPTDDSQNRPTAQLRPADPAYFETRYTFSPDSLLTSVVLPEGNSIQYTYDSGNFDVRLRANLLQSVSNPGPRGGDQPSITESWTYTTSFGDEPCVCKGCCGEGGGECASGHLIRGDCTCREGPYGFQRGDSPTGGGQADSQGHKALPRTEVVKKIWNYMSRMTMGKPMFEWIKGTFATSHQDGRGNVEVRTIDPATGNLLQVTAPTVTTGVLGGGTQNITESWQYNAFGQVTRYTSPTGRIDDYSYYTSGPATGYLKDVTIDAQGPLPGSGLALLTVTARDAFGNATAITDPKGNTETLVYNQLDQLVRRIAKPPFGYQTDSCYDANDRLAATNVQNVDEAGVIQPNASISTTYRYDARGHVVRETFDADTLNIRTEYEYDANDNLTLVRLPESVNGHQPTSVVRRLSDERDLRFKQIDAEGDPTAVTTQWDYNGNGRVLVIQKGVGATPSITTIAYDGYDRPVGATDAMGNLTTSHYDANGNATSIEIDGELIDGESGPNVPLSEMATTYDEANRPVHENVAFFDTATGAPIGDGVSTRRTYYNEASQVIRVEDDNGHGMDTSYDGAGRVAATHDAKGNTTSYGYDANSNVLSVTEVDVSDLPTPPEVFVSTSTFDTLDRTTSSTSSAGQVDTFLWDSRGNRTVEVDPRGNETRSVYDARSRLTASHRKMTTTGDGGGGFSFFLDATRSYDDDSRLVQQADDAGHATLYQYDPHGRLVATMNADGTAELQSWDVHGNLVTRVDANGSVTTATFDSGNRLTTRSIARAAGVQGTTSETWKYDGRSRVVYAQNNGSVVTRAYDSLSGVTEETLKIGSGPTRSLHGAFDGEGNRTSMTYPSSLTVETTYDPLDLQRTITTSGPGTCSGGAHAGELCTTNNDCLPNATCSSLSPRVTTYDYAGTGRVVRRANANGTQTTYAYDDARRMTRTTHVKLVPYAEIDDRTYAWDAMDNKTSRTEVHLFGGGPVHAYSYDSAGQMTQASLSQPGLPPAVTSYALDGAANRLSVVGGADAGPYSMNSSLPEPADQQVNQYTSTPFDSALAYDRNGNLVQKPGGGESMSYDYRNQMVQSSGPLGSAAYAYDPFGRRIVADGKEYFYDGEQEIEERSSSGALTRAYVHGKYGLDVSMALADVTGDGLLDRSYPLTDDLGNVVVVTGDSGDAIERYDYDDFGKPRFLTPGGSSIPQSAIGNPFLFNGRRYDSKTGLYDYRTRYLDPRAGRFTSRDSIGMWGDEESFGNGSAYVGNNPWSSVDPTGTHRWLFCNGKGQAYIFTGSTPSLAASGGVAAGGCAGGRWAIQLEGILQPGGGGPRLGSSTGTAASAISDAGGGGGGVGEVLAKWECLWSGGTWVHDLTDGHCIKPLQPMQTLTAPKLCPGHISCPPTLGISGSVSVNPRFDGGGPTERTIFVWALGKTWRCDCAPPPPLADPPYCNSSANYKCSPSPVAL